MSVVVRSTGVSFLFFFLWVWNGLGYFPLASCSDYRRLKMEKEKNTINSAYYLNEKEEKQWAQVSHQGADHDDFNNNIKSS